MQREAFRACLLSAPTGTCSLHLSPQAITLSMAALRSNTETAWLVPVSPADQKAAFRSSF